MSMNLEVPGYVKSEYQYQIVICPGMHLIIEMRAAYL